ncbi:MAG: type II toxin-antitoxin system Phd/YefM family antitoxin [Myxococcota bacterium]
MKASELRADIYRVLDRVLETGIPVEIERNGRVLRIVAEPLGSRLDRLVPHPDAVVGDLDELVHLDWSSEWRP